MPLKEHLSSILANPRVILVANLFLLAYFFFMEIVVYKSPSGKLPYSILVPGTAALCILGWYIVERGSTKLEKGVGYALSYMYLVPATLYFFGMR